jgi:glycosyltransferase involved in cell wall biosynthesis
VLHRTKVVDVELSSTPTDIEGLDGYTRLMVLARLHGAPIGIVHLPVTNGRCTATTIRKAILDRQQGWPIIHHLLCDLLAAPPCPDGWSVSDLLNAPHPAPGGPLPLVSVAVCTRDRPTDLAICLKALDQLDYPHLDVLVVDNAPGSDATERLMCETYPHIRYVREPRPGLDWARNRAIVEARGEIIAFTDDDAVVDPGWVRAIADLFVENPDVMAVTGLVMPYELETEAQILFELYGGFGRGCERKWYRLGQSDRERWKYYGTGQFGTGANMAYRRSLFDQIGYFDPALDVGTVTNGGGDLDMFFRVLVEGHTLVYEPRAIVRHRHRRDYGRLRMQIANNGVGLVSYWVRSALAYPEERLALLRVALWWLWYWDIRRLLMSFVRPAKFPRDLIQVELKGYFIGLTRYQKARQIADQIADTFDQFPSAITSEMHTSRNITDKLRSSIAVRTIDLAQPLTALADVTGHPMVRTFVTQNSHLLGHLDIHNDHQPISATYLRQAIANHIGLRLLKSDHNTSENLVWAELTTRLARHFMPARSDSETATPTRLSAAISVSVVVATRDRPDDLRTCLRCLMALKSPRQVEIVVVDNNPASGLTPPVAAEFPEVVLVGHLVCK